SSDGKSMATGCVERRLLNARVLAATSRRAACRTRSPRSPARSFTDRIVLDRRSSPPEPWLQVPSESYESLRVSESAKRDTCLRSYCSYLPTPRGRHCAYIFSIP